MGTGTGLVAAMLAVAFWTADAAAQEAREVFVCEFPEAGRVVIDTGEPDASVTASVTVGGTRYPVQSGSYFLQGTEEAPLVNGEPFVIFFGPGMAFWDLGVERTRNCNRSAGAASDPSATATAGRATADRRRLEGMDYNEARAIVVNEYGWAPRTGRCEGTGVTEETCAAYPETASCSGTGVGPCVMIFSRPGRCLFVRTIGGPPAPEIDGEPAVDDVTFGRGDCP